MKPKRAKKATEMGKIISDPGSGARGWLWGAAAVEEAACLGRTGLGLGSSPGGNGWIDREAAGRPMLAEWLAGSTVLPRLVEERGCDGCGCCSGAARGGSGSGSGAGGCGGCAGGGSSSSSVRSMNAGVDISLVACTNRPHAPGDATPCARANKAPRGGGKAAECGARSSKAVHSQAPSWRVALKGSKILAINVVSCALRTPCARPTRRREEEEPRTVAAIS